MIYNKRKLVESGATPGAMALLSGFEFAAIAAGTSAPAGTVRVKSRYTTHDRLEDVTIMRLAAHILYLMRRAQTGPHPALVLS